MFEYSNEKAIEYIFGFSHSGKPVKDLSRIKMLMSAIGDPQDRLKFVHIAGTNGKGTTANYLANIYRAHGLKVGLFTSPYLYNVNEMININGKEISDEELINAIKENQKLFDKYGLSAFEIQTFIALNYFSKNNCDLAIIECGMGGEIEVVYQHSGQLDLAVYNFLNSRIFLIICCLHHIHINVLEIAL